MPSFEIVQYGSMEKGYKVLCRRCFNTEAAIAAGLDDFEHAVFEPIRLTDSVGRPHEFHFRTFLFGTGVALDAFELRKGIPAGYQFQVIGEPEEDLFAKLGRLVEKMRRALSTSTTASMVCKLLGTRSFAVSSIGTRSWAGARPSSLSTAKRFLGPNSAE